ncbi:ABC transporter ATP-binding protein [Desulfobulbus oligotrophicus]|uniref:ABC transporter ATP-binding protein n=1 Tax=Desulfobulbus oligotrophicus TaxID=1909699 RepID=A0A7T5VE35_9BACT|nr:ABC transporter ATP-binding protein [Desulfobulbus oligotrophicus]QQG66069.1 ABC transporter ATP-binding protein [Desulfobulbus oligotrophicus]
MQALRFLLPFLKPYKRLAIGALICLVGLVIFDLSIPRLVQRIIDQGIRVHDQEVVLYTGLLMLCISLLSLAMAVANNYLSVKVGEGVARDLREAVFLQIQDLSFGNLDRMQTGGLMVRLASDTAAVQRIVNISLRIGTRAPLLMLGSLLLMVDTSPSLALRLLPLILLTLAIVTVFMLRMEPLFLMVQQQFDRLNTVLQENISGVRLIKAFVRADHERARFSEVNTVFTGYSIRILRTISTMSPLLTLCVNAGIVLVIWHGGLAAIQGELTVGQIVAFTNYLLTTLTPLAMMAMLSNAWANGLASIRRIKELLETVPEVTDMATGAATPLSALGEGPLGVSFCGVSFRYNQVDPAGNGEKGEWILCDIDLAVKPGSTVAILGATGAGKSTLINLIPRFYDVIGGSILVNGVDIRELRQQDLRALIAVVPQETILFSGTVADNIRYGKPGATLTEVETAARAAQAHDFIVRLPERYETRIEERGGNLSGGQRQRVAIARAILYQPRLLILDDSTSALDVDTEARLQQALTQLPFAHTSLLVAQRVSTVLAADSIVILDKGRVVSQGSHEELLAHCSIYQEIYASQLGDPELSASMFSEAVQP